MTKTITNKNRIAKSAATVSIALMCSRVLGLVREQIFAGLFGAGTANDAFVVAFRIPNLLRDLFAEGALSAAFITVFAKYDSTRSREETWQLASNVMTFVLILLSSLTLLAMFFAENLVILLADDFDLVEGKVALTVKLTQIMLPFLVFVSLSAVIMGILNTKKHFFVPAITSAFFNLGCIVGGTSLAFILPRYGYPAIVGMAIGTLIGGILQFSIQLPTLLKLGFRYRPTLNLTDPGLKQILKLIVPATIGLSAVQINIFINTSFAASCAEGSVSWLYYAFRLVQLPIGVFGVALSIAIMPLLAKQAAKKDIDELKKTMMSSLTMVFALTLPATAGLIILSEPIIRIIFERGAFTAADTFATAQTLAFYAIGLFAYSANKILAPAFYALDKPRYPVIASFLAILVNIIIITMTIDRFQHLAIAFSTSCTMLFNFLFLMTVLYIKVNGYSLSYLIKSLIKILFATLALCLLLLLVEPYFHSWLNGTLLQQISSLSLLIMTATIVYGAVLHLAKLDEMSVLSDKFRAKFSKG